MKMEADYRYPGAAPFQDTRRDRLLFYGRKKEEQLLLHKVLGERLVVLFGKSGIGKTSLLNAGLMQPLRENNCFPLPVRFNDPQMDPLQTLYEAAGRVSEEKGIEYRAGEKASLWDFFRTAEFWSAEDALLTPVLVLDQFEEFFALHDSARRKTFISELAELVRGRPSKRVQSCASLDAYSTELEIKVVFSIREDCLALLEEMASNIPEILLNRFRLTPLSREQAEAAIVEPAKCEDEAVGQKSFRFEPDAVQGILDFLCQRQEKKGLVQSNEVESFQLQLLCSHFENRFRQNPLHSVVKKSDLGGEAGMRKVMEGFYERQLQNRKGPKKRRNIRRLCEKGLIESGRRLSLEQQQIARKFRVSEKELEELVNNRLLRGEPRVGSVYYELSHDTLVRPIQEFQRRRNRKRAATLMPIVFVLVVLIAVLSVKVILDQSAQRKAEKLDLLYTELEKNAIRHYTNGAKAQFEEIAKLDPGSAKAYLIFGRMLERQYASDKAEAVYRQAIERGINDRDVFAQLAKILGGRGMWEEAVGYFHKARELDPDSAMPYIWLGDYYTLKEDFAEARQNYMEALKKDRKNAAV